MNGEKMSSVFRVAALVTTSGVFSALLVSQRDRFKAYATSKQAEEPVLTSSWDSNWDKRQRLNVGKSKGDSEGAEVDPKPTATRVLVLIRHGQYEAWHEDRDKHILTPLGREQAMLTGKRLQELNEKYDVIHYSTMPRAVETTRIVAKSFPNVPIKSNDLLREGAPIKPEPPSQKWKPDEYEFFCDSARIEAAFRKFFHRAPPSQKHKSVEVFVCHANVIRYFVCRALQLPPDAWLRMSLAHGSITRIVIRPTGNVSVTELGNSGHFPPDKISFH